jgi:hypothetical protein
MHTLRPLCSIVLSFGLLHAAAGHAAEPTPDATVRKAYTVTQKTLDGGGEPPWRPPHRDALMSKSLAALFARDDRYQDESGDIGHIGADPFIQGQDGEVKNLKVTVTQGPAAGKALVTASFRSFGKAMSVPFRMVEEGGGWRIDDIGSGKNSVRRDLAQPYDCGSFMGKPCKR